MKRLFPAAFLSLLTALPLSAAQKSGLDMANMDKSVRIQDDLYLAVNGTWLNKTEIPADRSNYGSFTALDDLSNERIRTLIEEAAASKNAPGSEAQKVGDFYRSFMNDARIEQLGLEPLKAELSAIETLNQPSELLLGMARLQTIGVRSPLGFYVGQDEKNSSQYHVNVYQSGLNLPDRDYFLKEDAKFVEARNAFKAYVTNLLTLSGTPAAKAESLASSLLELETQIAKSQRSNVELRDPEKNYNKLDIKALSELAPGLDWSAYFKALGVAEPGLVNVGQPEFIKSAAALLTTQSPEVWRAYLRVQLLDSYAIVLPKAFGDATFQFHGKALAGIPQDKPRWKKAVAVISGEGAGSFGALGDAVGHLYVQRHFSPVAKQRMDELVGNLFAAYRTSINDLTWMTPATRAKAAEKLGKYMIKIAYPQNWRDYSGLQVSADTLAANMLASERVEFQRNLSHLGKAVDRTVWDMTPQTVNAYYNPGLNEIVFPAAILQPPFFNAEADDAVNYGGIGAVIGHEISHGFDDQGCQFDGDGNLKNWWTPEDQKAFKALTSRLVAQYSAYEGLPGKHVNGELTLGENIADLSGIAIAFKAYHLSLHGKPAPVIDGLTGDQRFFMGWSQVWQRKYREAEMLKRLLTDPHSPSQFRANGAPINQDAFFEAFGIQPGDKLYKPAAERIKIW